MSGLHGAMPGPSGRIMGPSLGTSRKVAFFRGLIIIRLGHGGAEFWILIISERHHRRVSWFFLELSNALLELSKCSKEGLETRRFE